MTPNIFEIILTASLLVTPIIVNQSNPSPVPLLHHSAGPGIELLTLTPGKVGVVAYGALQDAGYISIFSEQADYIFPVAVYNGTSESISAVEASGTIRTLTGSLIGTAEQISGTPYLIAPDGIGIMYLAPTEIVTADLATSYWSNKTFEGLVTFVEPGGSLLSEGENSLSITEVARTPSGSLAGTASNTSKEVIYSASVYALCWDSQGKIEGTNFASLDNDRVASSQLASFSVDMSAYSCSSYLVFIGEDELFS